MQKKRTRCPRGSVPAGLLAPAEFGVGCWESGGDRAGGGRVPPNRGATGKSGRQKTHRDAKPCFFSPQKNVAPKPEKNGRRGLFPQPARAAPKKGENAPKSPPGLGPEGRGKGGRVAAGCSFPLPRPFFGKSVPGILHPGSSREPSSSLFVTARDRTRLFREGG